MVKQLANIIYQAGSTWSQPQPGYANQAQQQPAAAYQHALHGITPGMQMKKLKWMFNGEALEIKDFAEQVFGDDDSAKTMFLLKYT